MLLSFLRIVNRTCSIALGNQEFTVSSVNKKRNYNVGSLFGKALVGYPADVGSLGDKPVPQYSANRNQRFQVRSLSRRLDGCIMLIWTASLDTRCDSSSSPPRVHHGAFLMG